jgi:hypothetical protein
MLSGRANHRGRKSATEFYIKISDISDISVYTSSDSGSFGMLSDNAL